MHEKREALDAIELLKLFAKHKGISIEMVADDAPPPPPPSSPPSNETRTATINLDECQQKPTTPQQPTDDASTPPQQTFILTSNTIAEQFVKTTKEVIQMQPTAPINRQLSNVTPLAADKLIIEQTTPINMKKTTSDI